MPERSASAGSTPASKEKAPGPATVILGVTASDAHAVANRLIAMRLEQDGYRVVNLGPCTPVSEFVACFGARPDALAIAIGSLNGHAVEDLAPLREAKDQGMLRCPVIVGGNLSVSDAGRGAAAAALRDLGVDYVLDDIEQLVVLLGRLRAKRGPRRGNEERGLAPVA